jgi:hypothetical protein
VSLGVGYEQLTVSSTSIGLASIPQGANNVLIKVVTANVRLKNNGDAPTTSAGFPLTAGDIFEATCNPADLRFIRDDADDATLEVLYYRA